MRLPKESVLQIWKARKAAVREELAIAEQAAKTTQDKLDRLDQAFLFDRSIDIETYDRRPAVPTAVLSGGNFICSNRRNRTGL